MFTEKKGVILNLIAGGVLVGMPPSKRIEYQTEQCFKVGQVVWISYDFTHNVIASLRHQRRREDPSPNNTPEPMADWGFEDDIHPITEEEEVVEGDGVTWVVTHIEEEL